MLHSGKELLSPLVTCGPDFDILRRHAPDTYAAANMLLREPALRLHSTMEDILLALIVRYKSQPPAPVIQFLLKGPTDLLVYLSHCTPVQISLDKTSRFNRTYFVFICSVRRVE